MTERRVPRRVLLLGVALSGVSACFDLSSASGEDPRFLDRACNAGQCAVTGSARLVAGLTADSRGVKLGPGPGSLTIDLQNAYYGTSGESVSLLVAGHGEANAGAGPFTIPSEYDWVSAAVVYDPIPDGGMQNGGSQYGPTSHITLQLTDSTSELDLVDVKAPGYDYSGAGSCSVAHVGLRRR